MTKCKLLIVEDDEDIRTHLKYALSDEYTLSFAEDRSRALSAVAGTPPDLVSLDLGLPPAADTAEEGLKALEEILRIAPRTKVVVVTGNGERDNAVKAVQLGAFDYLPKPLDLGAFRVILQRAAYLRQLEADVERKSRESEAALTFENILGSTPRMREIFGIVNRVAKTDVTVLIQGESGTGKELLAQAIHASSARHKQPFVPINCGAIPETLLESELFGHEKGAYTGAHIQRKGRIEAAHGGTLFLDEVGEMTLPLQVKLLRFLQEREIERVGGRDRIRINVRVIAATNKDLMTEIQAGRFREDLYYRLSIVTVKLPPLRERGEDVVLLANAFLRRSTKEHRRNVRFSEEALRGILKASWPGNIRELQNRIERAVILAPGKLIRPEDLELEPPAAADDGTALKGVRDRAERQALIDVLIAQRGNISQSAKALKVSRPTLHALLDKHNVNAREFRR